jgi:hypothetical protein
MTSPLLDWMKKQVRAARRRRDAAAQPAKPQAPAASGEYQSLYTYLANRYAHTIVLTFAEIEDLLGFSLPEVARLRPEWWTTAAPKTAGRPNCSDAWTLASRTAKPNLLAQTVAFERAS